jgi:hypothetical protein
LSAWNTSNGFPDPGKTITLGPVGRVAQPLSASADNTERPRRQRVGSIFPSYRSGGFGDGTTCIHPPGHSLTYGKYAPEFWQ